MSFGAKKPRRYPPRVERPVEDVEGAEGAQAERKKPKQSARQYMLWLLGRREWSQKELRDRLKLKGYEEAQIEDALTFCAGHGLQSDNRFAASRTRMRANLVGNRRLSMELTQRGVAKDTVEAALEEAGDESERALMAVRRFEGKPWSPELKTKAWRFLMTRGFSSRAVENALRFLEGKEPR